MDKKIRFSDLDWALKSLVIMGLIASGLILLNFIFGLIYGFFGG